MKSIETDTKSNQPRVRCAIVGTEVLEDMIIEFARELSNHHPPPAAQSPR